MDKVHRKGQKQTYQVTICRLVPGIEVKYEDPLNAAQAEATRSRQVQKITREL